LTEWYTDPTKIGVTVLLLTAVLAFSREWVVAGITHTKMLAERDAQIEKLRQERDEFLEMAKTSLSVTERTQQTRSRAYTPKSQ